MGRPKLNKTAKEIAEQKRRWLDSYNRRRKARYHSDSVYRDAIRNRSRTDARLRGGGVAKDRLSVCSRALADLRSFGQIRKLVGGKSLLSKVRTFTSAELAPLLGLSHVVMLHKWQRAGKFPRGDLVAQFGHTYAHVYSLPMAKRLLTVMLGHLRKKNYVLSTDEETIAKFNACAGGSQ